MGGVCKKTARCAQKYPILPLFLDNLGGIDILAQECVCGGSPHGVFGTFPKLTKQDTTTGSEVHIKV